MTVSSVPVPIHRGFHLILYQPLHKIRAHDILSESLLLQKFEMLQRRPRICQILEIGWLGPVLEVGKVCDEGGLREEFLRRKVI